MVYDRLDLHAKSLDPDVVELSAIIIKDDISMHFVKTSHNVFMGGVESLVISALQRGPFK